MTGVYEPLMFDLPGVATGGDAHLSARDLNAPDDRPWPQDVFAHLPVFGYDLIMADPPWHYATHSGKGQGKGAARHYKTWTLDKIKRLPVRDLAAGDCVLFLWAISPLVLDLAHPSRSPVGEVIEAWGFRYGAIGGWAKKTVNDKDAFGSGYVVRSAMEPFFLCHTGKPQHSKACRNIINGLRGEHSEKPDAAYRWCETYMPRGRRIEICSRTNRKGWDVWGDETGKLGEVSA